MTKPEKPQEEDAELVHIQIVSHEQSEVTRRAEARDMVTSWFLASWAILAALYILTGGANQLSTKPWHYVLNVFGGSYHIVGGTLLFAAIINLAGVIGRYGFLIIAGSVLISTWLLAISLLTGLAALQFGGGNMTFLACFGLGGCYIIRAYNKYRTPKMIGAAVILPALLLMGMML